MDDPIEKSKNESIEDSQKSKSKSCKKIKRKLKIPLTELTCPICSDLFIKPITTHCGHTFCSVCLTTSTSSDSRCPMCRTDIIVDKISNNVVLCSMLDKIKSKNYIERKQAYEIKESIAILISSILNNEKYVELYNAIYKLIYDALSINLDDLCEILFGEKYHIVFMLLLKALNSYIIVFDDIAIFRTNIHMYVEEYKDLLDKNDIIWLYNIRLNVITNEKQNYLTEFNEWHAKNLVKCQQQLMEFTDNIYEQFIKKLETLNKYSSEIVYVE